MPSVKKVIEGYIQLRDNKDAIKKRHKDELAPVNEKMMMIENWLLGELTTAESDSITAKGVGTAFKSTRTSAKIDDWETVLKHIKEEELWHMLERRISKTAVEEYIEANGEPPEGVHITREITVQVRRA